MKDFPAVSPHAEIRPYVFPVNFEFALRNSSLRHIALAFGHETAQPRSPHRGAVEEPAPGVSMQRLEHEFLLFFRQAREILAAEEMGLRHMVVQDLSFCGTYLQFVVPVRQRQPFQEPLIAARRIGEGIRRDIDAARLIGRPQGRKVVRLPEEIGRAIDDESGSLSFEQQSASIPAGLCGTSQFGPPAALAQQLTKQSELFAKFALLQRLGIVENEKRQIAGVFSKECPRLLLYEISNAVFEHRQMGRRCYSLVLRQSRRLVVQGIDDRSKYETRPVIVELDQPPGVPGGQVKVPCAEKAKLSPSELCNGRGFAQRRDLPGLAGGNAIKGANEIGYFGEDSGGNDLMLRQHREFFRRLWHSGCKQRGEEVLA